MPYCDGMSHTEGRGVLYVAMLPDLLLDDDWMKRYESVRFSQCGFRLEVELLRRGTSDNAPTVKKTGSTPKVGVT